MRRLSHVASSAPTGGMKSRTSFAIAGAVLLSLLMAGQSLAASWGAVPLTSSGTAMAEGLVTLGTSTAVAVYSDIDAVFVRRSTDSGATWKAPLRLAATGWDAAIAGRGTKVDVVWIKVTSSAKVVRYARSSDSGKTFRPSVRLSPKAAIASFPSVARGPDGRVAVAWYDESSSKVRVRVSTNGGASFASGKTMATVPEVSSPAVTIGKGVIYVAYNDRSRPTDRGLVVRRSTNSGSTWSSARLVAADSNGDPLSRVSITAEGGQAYIAYRAGMGPEGTFVRYSRTTDKGKNWTSPANLSSPAAFTSGSPRISLRSGVVRVVFERNLDENGSTGAVFYRQSANGTSWTAAEMVSVPTITPWAWPAGVGFAGKIIVLYTGWSPNEPWWDNDVWAGTR
jgi:hypothetical protein